MQDPRTYWEELIREAYQDLAGYGSWCMISDIRNYLGRNAWGPYREDVSEVLRQMGEGASRVHLAPESNQQALTSEHRAGAVRMGGQDKHALLIEEGY